MTTQSPIAVTTQSPIAPARRLGRLATHPVLRVLAFAVAVAVSMWSLHRVPHTSWGPVLLGMTPWLVGKYVLCPLRWHALSVAGRRRRWHLRIFAEGELLGLITPGHIGADVWRAHKLRDAGLDPPSAVAEVALDRLLAALGLTAFVLMTGVTLPARVLVAGVGLAAAVLVGALLVRRHKPGLMARRPLPRPKVVLAGIALSIGYQLTMLALLMGSLEGLGQEVGTLQLIGVFGASQVAAIVPGLQGASPKDGALVVGLASIGITWSVALGAVALTTLLAWGPALLLGGGSLAVRRVNGRRSAAPAPA
jgi:hypothetical protein